jgi:SAM-dependent methyltransferase
MDSIDYDHSQNLHLMDGPSSIFPIINRMFQPKSILDVGCGVGTWLKMAEENQLVDYLGIDGIEVPDERFHVSKGHYKQCDLRKDWDLGRTFDMALCLEVAEHLPSNASTPLISSLTKHSDTVIFSAACPYQGGQGHVNCQWPLYWQELFNSHGFVCVDSIRPVIWELEFREYWYKQNMFVATKDFQSAGSEARLQSIVHPDLYEGNIKNFDRLKQQYDAILSGSAGFSNYLSILSKMPRSLADSTNRRLSRMFNLSQTH